MYPRHFSYTETRSEEHTSELQSLRHLVCRLLLEKKNYRWTMGHRMTSEISPVIDAESRAVIIEMVHLATRAIEYEKGEAGVRRGRPSFFSKLGGERGFSFLPCPTLFG